MKFTVKREDIRRALTPAKTGLVFFMLFCVAIIGWSWLSGGQALEEPEQATLSPADADALPGPDQDGAGQPGTEEDAASVSAAYFAAYRMDREQARAEELELLQRIIDDQGSSPAIREDAEQRRLAIAGAVEQEARAESLLKAKNFGETVVMLGQAQATVIVAVEMDDHKAAQIAELVDSATGCGFENVVIVNR